MGSGGVEISFESVMNGTHNVEKMSADLAHLKATKPGVEAALWLNEFENGGF